MFAVIKTGGKQYRVQKGDILEVEKLNEKEGKNISFDRVLLIETDKKTLIGTPFLKGAQVNAEILDNFKGKKVIVFKKKRRKQYKKKKGHRQELTRVRIEDIQSAPKTAPANKTAEAKVASTSAKPKPKAKVKAAPKKPAVKKAAPKAKTAAAAKPKAKPAAEKKVSTKPQTTVDKPKK